MNNFINNSKHICGRCDKDFECTGPAILKHPEYGTICDDRYKDMTKDCGGNGGRRGVIKKRIVIEIDSEVYYEHICSECGQKFYSKSTEYYCLICGEKEG